MTPCEMHSSNLAATGSKAAAPYLAGGGVTKVTGEFPKGSRNPGSDPIEWGRMSPFHRHRWFAAAAGITLAFAGVWMGGRRSGGLTAFSDLACLGVMLVATGVSLANALTRPREERSFWMLMTLGLSLWASNLGAWAYQGILRHQEAPDPYFFDIILFFHMVPMISAVAWRPDLLKKEGRPYLSMLNFLMLLGWWLFLYAFIVFPHQYVVLNVVLYNRYYDWLYRLESVLLLIVLGFVWLISLC